ncbi:MAG TPA: hypothetical protein VKD72_35100, partial [Gemmataceae bacterium]|nr:hypothetical protein [Gemmataceae bacterium]
VVAASGRAQIFNPDGSAHTSGFNLAPSYGRPAVSIAADGSVVLAWGDGRNVQARRFANDGTPLESSSFVVSTTTARVQERPSVAVTPNGFVVAWSGNGVGDDAGVFVQRYAAASPLLASAPPATSSSEVLSQGELQPLVQEAIARWQATGLSSAQMDLLRSISIQIADLGGTTLGLATGNVITIDDNAAGWGWFIDPTPSDDSEFRLPGDQGEQNHMDLLTVQFVAEFTPDPEASTGRFARVTGGSFIMTATTEPFVLQPNEQGYTGPFHYTWAGEGTIEFSTGKT